VRYEKGKNQGIAKEHEDVRNVIIKYKCVITMLIKNNIFGFLIVCLVLLFGFVK